MTEFKRADRINSVSISDIVIMSEAARARRAEGHDVISLGIGEPDFTTPDHVNEAAIAAIHACDTKYPPVAGKPELRQAVADQYDGAKPENVVVSSGSKFTLFSSFMASLNDGDDVVIPAPFWTSYEDIVTIAGGNPIVVPSSANEGFLPNPERLRAAMTPRTKWILINNPSNPSGAVMPRELLHDIGGILDDFPNCWLMSDEIYQHLTYEAEFHSAYDVLPHLRDRMLITNGVSKAYAMTGWRLGYAIGPKALIKGMIDVQAQGTSGVTTIAQAAALAALTGPQDLLEERRQSFKTRRDLVLKHLNAMEGLETPTPEGAFYTFTNWERLRGGKTPDGTILKTDKDFCQYILTSANVTVIPGSGFAADGHFRISYACSTDELTRALTRMAEAVSAITKP